MGNNVIIAVGEASRSFRGMVQLNASAAEIWTYISKGYEKDAIVDEMLQKYEVEREVLAADVEKSIKLFVDNGMVEI